MISVESILQNLPKSINWSDPLLLMAAAHITFNPLFWNITARLEYRTKLISKIFGSAKASCYVLAAIVFSIGITRNILVAIVVLRQMSMESFFDQSILGLVKFIGTLIIIAGLTLAISSMRSLGIIGTYLGDYFGMLKTERVTCFPYNVCSNPMYVGSTVAFLGLAIHTLSPVGFLLTAYIWLVYYVALYFEEPFTAEIYSNKKAD